MINTHKVKAIEVVNVSVFPAIGMDTILVHGDLRTIEHRRLVHVVPVKEVGTTALIAVMAQAACPPITNVLAGEVWVA